MPTTKHRKAIVARLGQLAELRTRVDASDGKIKDAAEDRLEKVRADLEKLAPRVVLDDAVAARYEALTLEKGRLERVLLVGRR